MRSNILKKILLSILLITIVLLTFPVNLKEIRQNNIRERKLFTSSSPNKIHINGNWSQTASVYTWCTGSGTYSDPYIIQDLVIDATNIGNAILIEYTSDYFVIKNCIIFNSGIDGGDAAIKLHNVSNGKVIKNNCSNNLKSGIGITSSFNTTISGNIANNNSRHGMYIQGSTDQPCYNNTISGNFFIDNDETGILILYSSNCILYLNNIVGKIDHNAYDDGVNNQWDNGTIGNYWSDYSGKDIDDDGIGDSPYSISGTASSQDNYPIFWDPPNMSIITPLVNGTFGKTAPEYNLSIEGVPQTMWYTIAGTSGNFSITELTGTIDQDAWNNLTEGDITITFYAQDSEGEVGFNSITVIKSIPSKIPGYNLFFLLGILSVAAIIITKKIKK